MRLVLLLTLITGTTLATMPASKAITSDSSSMSASSDSDNTPAGSASDLETHDYADTTEAVERRPMDLNQPISLRQLISVEKKHERLLQLVDAMRLGKLPGDLPHRLALFDEADRLVADINFCLPPNHLLRGDSFAALLEQPVVRSYVLRQVLHGQLLQTVRACLVSVNNDQRIADLANIVQERLQALRLLLVPGEDEDLWEAYEGVHDWPSLVPLLGANIKADEVNGRRLVLLWRFQHIVQQPVLDELALNQVISDVHYLNASLSNSATTGNSSNNEATDETTATEWLFAQPLKGQEHDPATALAQEIVQKADEMRVMFDDKLKNAQQQRLAKYHMLRSYQPPSDDEHSLRRRVDHWRTISDMVEWREFWDVADILTTVVMNPESVGFEELLTDVSQIIANLPLTDRKAEALLKSTLKSRVHSELDELDSMLMNAVSHPSFYDYQNIEASVHGQQQVLLFLGRLVLGEQRRQLARLCNIYGHCQRPGQVHRIVQQTNALIGTYRLADYLQWPLNDQGAQMDYMLQENGVVENAMGQLRSDLKKLREIVRFGIVDTSAKMPEEILDDDTRRQVDSLLASMFVAYSWDKLRLHSSARLLIWALNVHVFNVSSSSPQYHILKALVMCTSEQALLQAVHFLNDLKELCRLDTSLRQADLSAVYASQEVVNVAHMQATRLAARLRRLEAAMPPILHGLRPQPTLLPPHHPHIVPRTSEDWYSAALRARPTPVLDDSLANFNPSDPELFSSLYLSNPPSGELNNPQGDGHIRKLLWTLFAGAAFEPLAVVDDAPDSDLPPTRCRPIAVEGTKRNAVPRHVLRFLCHPRHLQLSVQDPMHAMVWALRAQRALYIVPPEDSPLWHGLHSRYRQLQRALRLQLDPADCDADVHDNGNAGKRDLWDVIADLWLMTPLVTEALEDVRRPKPKQPALLTLFLGATHSSSTLPFGDCLFPGPPNGLVVFLGEQFKRMMQTCLPANLPHRSSWLAFWEEQVLFGLAGQAMAPLVEIWAYERHQLLDLRKARQLCGYALQQRSQLLYEQVLRWTAFPEEHLGMPPYERPPPSASLLDFRSSPFVKRESMTVDVATDGFGRVDDLDEDDKFLTRPVGDARPSRDLAARIQRSAADLVGRFVRDWRWLATLDLRFNAKLLGLLQGTNDWSGVMQSAAMFLSSLVNRPARAVINNSGVKYLTPLGSVPLYHLWAAALAWQTYDGPGTTNFVCDMQGNFLFSSEPQAYSTTLDAPLSDDDALNKLALWTMQSDDNSAHGFDSHAFTVVQGMRRHHENPKKYLYAEQWTYHDIAPNGFRRQFLSSFLTDDLCVRHWGLQLEEDVVTLLDVLPNWLADSIIVPSYWTNIRIGLLNARFQVREMLYRITFRDSQLLKNSQTAIAHFREARYELDDVVQEMVISAACSIPGDFFDDSKAVTRHNYASITAPDGQTGVKALLAYYLRHDLLKDAKCKGMGLGNPLRDRTALDHECRQLRQQGLDLLLSFATGTTKRILNKPLNVSCISATAKFSSSMHTAATCFQKLILRQVRSYDEFRDLMDRTLKIFQGNPEAMGFS